jgi:MFS family permease
MGCKNANNAMTSNTDSIWTRPFALLCLAQLLGYAQHAILTPTLPLYITHLGGSPLVVGAVLAAFAATSVVVRPVFGEWADRWSEAGVMACGLFFSALSQVLCFIPLVETTMLSNALRGIGWAGLNTGGYSLLASTAPPSKRGEASGYYSGIQGSATILFPAFALWIIDARFGGFNAAFGAAIAFAVIGAVAGAGLARHNQQTVKNAQLHPDGDGWREFFAVKDKEVFLPALMLFTLNLSFPAVTSFLVLHARNIGIENFGSYFVISGATNLIARPTLGRLSDRIGPHRSLSLGFAFQLCALLLLLFVSSLFAIAASGVLYMLGNAIGSATSLALAVERANPQRRGKAMAMFSVAYPMSYGAGSLLIGSAVEFVGFTGMFLTGAAISAVGVGLVAANRSRLK